MRRIFIIGALLLALGVSSAQAAPDPVASLQATLKTSVTLRSAPGVLSPPMSQWGPGYWWSHYSLANNPAHRVCFGDASTTVPLPAACSVFGDRRSEHRAFLIGDSRAFQWLPALHVWGQSRHWRVSALTKANCRPWTNTPYFSGAPGQPTGAPYPSCTTFNRSVLATISAQHPSYVFVTAMRGRTGTASFESNAQIRVGMVALARTLQQRGAVVVFLGPNPEWFASSGLRADVFPPDCVVHNLTSVMHCVGVGATGGGRAGVIEAGYFNAMVDAARITSSIYLPTPDLFCVRNYAVSATAPNATAYGACPLLVSGTLAYLDRQHITREYAQFIGSAFATLIDRSIVPPPA